MTVAEELAQETFYRATRAFLGWRGGSPAAWLLAIARNVLVDEVRRGQRLVPLSETLPAQGGEPSTMSMGVRDTLARLPANQGRQLAGDDVAAQTRLPHRAEGAAVLNWL